MSTRHLFAIGLLAAAASVVVSGSASAAPEAPAAAPSTAPAAKDTVVVDARTEEVIKAALKYLSAKQMPNGAWTSHNGDHPVAITGYTLMAFLSAGHLPNEGEYGKHVSAGVEFLMKCVRDDGYINSQAVYAGKRSSDMYDHGIATLALAEVYGHTQDVKLREKLVLAIKLIVSSQSPQGGWRYSPRPSDADISVTVLQVVALRAAKNSGLDVPQKTIDRAVAYVKTCHDPASGGFSYTSGGKGPGFARTAAAIYSLQVCGQYDDPMVAKGAAYLLKHKQDGGWYSYGHFYAAPALYMIGGEAWKKWYSETNKTLLSKVVTNQADKSIAYWNSIGGDGRNIGPVYHTAVYTTILAMPWHYIPLYQR